MKDSKRFEGRRWLHFHRARVLPAGPRSWKSIAEEVRHDASTHVGIDIFDTVLLRTVDPDAIGGLVAQELVRQGLWNGDPAEYLEERSAAQHSGGMEGILDWYKTERLGTLDVSRCLALEFELETSWSEPYPGADSALEIIRASGKTLTFLADTHLPGEFVEFLLTKHGLLTPADLVLVSADLEESKAEGDLYQAWLDRKMCDAASDALYIGNDRWSDVATPRAVGISATLLDNANPNRFEASTVEAGNLSAAISSASIRARLSLDPVGGDEFVELGASVGGQALLHFVLAVRRRAQETGTKQIAFLARDGELLLKMAEALPQEIWGDCSLHYLHGNRLTWTLAGAETHGVAPWIKLGRGVGGFLDVERFSVSKAQLVGRLGLDLDDLPGDLRFVAEPGRLAPASDSDWDELLEDPRVQELIGARARERAALVEGYLGSIGLNRRPTMLVDIGWRGQTVAVVSDILERALGGPVLNYHFGGYGVRPEIDALCWIERFAFDDSREPIKLDAVDACVELFTAFGQPRARSYRWDGDRVLPVLDDGVPDMASADRDKMWNAAIETASQLDLRNFGELVDEDPASAAVDVLEMFWNRPTAREARAVAKLVSESDEAGSVLRSVAVPFGWQDLRSGGRSSVDRRWTEGSIAASNSALRPLLRIASKVKHR